MRKILARGAVAVLFFFAFLHSDPAAEASQIKRVQRGTANFDLADVSQSIPLAYAVDTSKSIILISANTQSVAADQNHSFTSQFADNQTISVDRAGGTVAASVVPAARADVIAIDETSYAAIAYSPATGQYGYAYNYRSRSAAENAALRNCRGSDARIVAWVNNGFCSLALGDSQSCWGACRSYGSGASTREANGFALRECNSRTGGARIVVCLSSDGQFISRR